MKNRIWIFLILLGTAGFLYAQDLPPMPPMDAAPGTGSDLGLPALPGEPSALPPSSDMSGLPPMPGQETAPLPALGAPSVGSDMSGLPPMPGQELPALPATEPSPLGSDMSGLPALPGQELSPLPQAAPQPMGSELDVLPSLPSQEPAALPAMAAPPAGSDMGGLPPLPGQEQPMAGAGQNALPALPALPPGQPQAAAPSGTSPLPPLPSQPQAASPAGAPPLPPLPGQQPIVSQPAPAAPVVGEAAPAQETVAAETPKPKVVKKVEQPWQMTKWRPGVIFSGWVYPKKSNAIANIAWASQHVLNALEFHGFKVVKETGLYPGQDKGTGKQWREFEFTPPDAQWNHNKHPLFVYLRQEGKRVWLRVGPSEPPPHAIYTVTDVAKMRDVSLKALGYIQKEFGRSLKPRQVAAVWETTYNFAKDEVRP